LDDLEKNEQHSLLIYCISGVQKNTQLIHTVNMLRTIEKYW